jgi:hypothetical protein
MKNQFHFKNFEPEFKLRFQANLVLNRIMDEAPYGSMAVGLLLKQSDETYRCALDVYSKHGPFMANAVGITPEQALKAMEEKIKNQLGWWKSHRGGPVPPAPAIGGNFIFAAS